MQVVDVTDSLPIALARVAITPSRPGNTWPLKGSSVPARKGLKTRRRFDQNALVISLKEDQGILVETLAMFSAPF